MICVSKTNKCEFGSTFTFAFFWWPYTTTKQPPSVIHIFILKRDLQMSASCSSSASSSSTPAIKSKSHKRTAAQANVCLAFQHATEQTLLHLKETTFMHADGKTPSQSDTQTPLFEKLTELLPHLDRMTKSLSNHPDVQLVFQNAFSSQIGEEEKKAKRLKNESLGALVSYSFRPECQSDTRTFKKALQKKKDSIRISQWNETGEDEAVDGVTFMSTASLKELRAVADTCVDCHVIHESLNFTSKFTGERYYDRYVDGEDAESEEDE